MYDLGRKRKDQSIKIEYLTRPYPKTEKDLLREKKHFSMRLNTFPRDEKPGGGGEKLSRELF